MNNTVRKALLFVTNSNLFIGCCGYFFVQQGMITLRLSENLYFTLYPLFIALSVVVIYSVQRLYLANKSAGSHVERDKWYQANKKLMIALSLIATAGIILLFFFFPPKLILYLTPLLGISLLYYLGPWPLRKLRAAKGFFIALVWSACTIAIPYLLFENKIAAEKMIYLLLGTFFLIAGLCVPFDIRDAEIDRIRQIKSIPVIRGVRGSKLISSALILLFPLFYFVGKENSYLLISALITSVVSIAVVLFSSSKKNELYFSILVDGMLLFHFFSVKICSEFFAG
jgi:hypothetical protein